MRLRVWHDHPKNFYCTLSHLRAELFVNVYLTDLACQPNVVHCLVGNFGLEDTKSKYLNMSYKAPAGSSLCFPFQSHLKLHYFSAPSITLHDFISYPFQPMVLYIYTHTCTIVYMLHYIDHIHKMYKYMCMYIHTYMCFCACNTYIYTYLW